MEVLWWGFHPIVLKFYILLHESVDIHTYVFIIFISKLCQLTVVRAVESRMQQFTIIMSSCWKNKHEMIIFILSLFGRFADEYVFVSMCILFSH